MIFWIVLIKLCLALLTLFVCAALFMSLYKAFRNVWVKIGSFLLLFAYGVVIFMIDPGSDGKQSGSETSSTVVLASNNCARCGYLLGSNAPSTIVTGRNILARCDVFPAVNNTISMFFPSRGGNDFSSRPSSQLFYLLTHVYAALLGLSLFARRPMNHCLGIIHILLAVVLRRSRKRYVFFGGGEPARLLAKDVLRTKAAVCEFYLDKSLDDNKKLFDELDEMGATVIYKNLDDAQACQSCIKQNKIFPFRSSYFFLDDNDDFNVRMAMAILAAVSPENGEEVHLYIRTMTERIMFGELPKYVEMHILVPKDVFNQSDLTASRFVSRHPMLHCPGDIDINHNKLLVQGKFNLLLLGFGNTGQELLAKCVCDAQFINTTFSATVIERDMESNYADYRHKFEEYIEEYKLNFQASDASSAAFMEWFKLHGTTFNRIIVALGDDKINIKVATSIANRLKSAGKSDEQCRALIFVLVRKNFNYRCYNGQAPFTLFGNMAEGYTQDIIINESDDKIAKMVNYVYNQPSGSMVKCIDWNEAKRLWWEETAPFYKNSSRAVAQNINNLFRIATGKDITNLSDTELEDALTQFKDVIDQPAKLDILAENEHRRWNAFHFSNGIRRLNIDEITGENAKLVDENKLLIKHGCLVLFSELDAISSKVNANRRQKNNDDEEDYAESDRRIVRHFPLFIRESKRKES